jgi:hypothetical protein
VTAPRKYATKTRGRPFAKGNPGKPKGARHRTTLLIEAMTDDDREAIIGKIIRQAKRGDRASQKLIVDRIEPVRKARVKFKMRPIVTVDDVVAAMAEVAAAVASEKLSLEEAASACIIIEKTRDAIKTQEHEVRLRALEEKLSQ